MNHLHEILLVKIEVSNTETRNHRLHVLINSAIQLEYFFPYVYQSIDSYKIRTFQTKNLKQLQAGHYNSPQLLHNTSLQVINFSGNGVLVNSILIKWLGCYKFLEQLSYHVFLEIQEVDCLAPHSHMHTSNWVPSNCRMST